MDSSLIDADVQPTYVTVKLKGKVSNNLIIRCLTRNSQTSNALIQLDKGFYNLKGPSFSLLVAAVQHIYV